MRLPASAVIRCKTPSEAAFWFAAIPAGHAMILGTNIVIIKPIAVTFSK